MDPSAGECTGPGSRIAGDQLICNLGDVENKTVRIPVLLKVLGSAKNGDTVPMTATVAADNAPAKTSSPVSTTVSAAARFDLAKNEFAYTSGQKGRDGVTEGVLFQYGLTVQARPQVAGIPPQLGIEPLTSPITLTRLTRTAGSRSPSAI